MQTVITLLADGLMIPIVLLAGYALLFRVRSRDRYDLYTRVFMAGISSYFAAKVLGSLWQPEQLRPFEVLGVDPGAAYLNNPGFPSDHALFAAFLALAVWYVTKHRMMTLAMAAMTLLVCVGRVLALVHTPLDVAGGLVVAGIGSVWYIHDTAHAKNTLHKLVAKLAKR